MCSGLRPTLTSRFATRSSRSLADEASLWMMKASPRIAPTVMRGLSEANGSWNTIWMSRRIARRSSPSRPSTFLPSKTISPSEGSIRRITQRAVVDLPQPDSPTSPSVSPRFTANETPSTAWTRAISRDSSPPLMAKCFLRPVTRSSGSLLSGLLMGSSLMARLRDGRPCDDRARSRAVAALLRCRPS